MHAEKMKHGGSIGTSEQRVRKLGKQKRKGSSDEAAVGSRHGPIASVDRAVVMGFGRQ